MSQSMSTKTEIRRPLTLQGFSGKHKRVSVLLACTLLCTLLCSGVAHFKAAAAKPSGQTHTHSRDFTELEAYLDTVRQTLKIPGMSAAIVQDQELVWAAGFGYADLENQIAATPDTPYGLASVTKPVAAVLIMQLVEEGLIELDAPITEYGVNSQGGSVTVRHLLTHTSEGIPGTKHEYNGSRYGLLGGVIEGATGRTFAENLNERILNPLEMKHTALNPMNVWGGPSLFGMDDLKSMLGWGAGFQHYPDVYLHLARPYQFDSEYKIIPGMYHLYHNPGAGLISSVTDLAKFDIALDQGMLLGDITKAEMHAPAVSTNPNRSELNYGLGWYVQDFEGLQLLWHTGRWSPSTSALYLKVPKKNLTFIVLANTDNLTVPFASIGAGDVSKSTLVLAFYRYFIFPEQHGYNLPRIDWYADQAVLLQQLAHVEDKAARKFLEREMWSFRQAFASSGQTGQVEKLNHVSRVAFPRSKFRRDGMFTQTAGPQPVISPVLHASYFVWLSRVVILWLLLVFISVIWMAMYLLRTAKFSGWGKILWGLSTFILGPIAPILINRLSCPGTDQPQPTDWRRACGASALTVTGYSAAWFAAIALLMNLGGNPHPLAILWLTYFLPLFVGFLFVRIPFLNRRMKTTPWRFISRSLLSEITILNLGYAVFFPLTMLLDINLLSQIPQPSNPIFWAMISFIALVGILLLTPLHYWMLRRGSNLPSGLAANEPSSSELPGLRTTWPALLTTSVIIVVALGITISQLG